LETALNFNDRGLVKKMLAGNDRAFDEFFDAYFPRLFRFARARLKHDDDAEEVAQAAICRAIAKLETYRGEAALFTWLCTFCRHEISGHLKRNGARQATALIEDAPEVRAALESAGVDHEGPVEALERADVARLARVALDHLPVRHAQALEWKYLEDLPVREIAERLNCSPKAAESLLTRARDGFRDVFTTLTQGPLPNSP
jgi:RNA polymerase sigma-70 factor (ECF subfamily)